MRTQNHTGRIGRRTITIHNTNRLLGGGDVDVMAGKTGFISKAGYCLATLLRLPTGNQPSPSSSSARVEHRPLLGDQAPVQLAVAEGRRSVPQRQQE